MFIGGDFVFFALALIAEIIGTLGSCGSSVFFVPFVNFDFHSVLGSTALSCVEIYSPRKI